MRLGLKSVGNSLNSANDLESKLQTWQFQWVQGVTHGAQSHLEFLAWFSHGELS